MNRRVLIAVIAIVSVVIVATAGLFIARALTSADTAAAPDADVEQTPSPSATTDAPDDAPTETVTPGVYVDYTETAIAEAEGRVVLFFHATWCGQCVQLDSDIRAEGVPDGVTVIKVDWDTNQALEQQYEVPMRTTFVELADDGSVVQRHVAYEEPRFANVVAAMNL
jgi:hypothetical protein